MRLYDRFLRYGLLPVRGLDQELYPDTVLLRDVMDASTVIVADDITQQVVQAPYRHERDMPALVPPAPYVFLETRTPTGAMEYPWSMVLSGGATSVPLRGWGLAIYTEDFGDSDEGAVEALADFNRYRETPLLSVQEPLRWILNMAVVLHGANDQALIGPGATMILGLDRNGQVGFADSETQMFYVIQVHAATPSASQEYQTVTTTAFTNPLLYTVALLNCQNIDMVAPLPSRQEARERKRRNLRSVRYHQLVVKVPGKRVQAEAQRRPVKVGETPIHFVRGNFARYTDEKPLFGKLTGTFYRPPHVRGNAEVGAVLKDYRVKGAA